MLLKYKDKFGPGVYEKRQLVKIGGKKPSDAQRCNRQRDKWCWEYAFIRGLPDGWRQSGPDKQVD
jgi:hypothetical protein